MRPGRGILVRWRVPVGDRGLPALAAPDPVLRVGHTRPGGLSRVGVRELGRFLCRCCTQVVPAPRTAAAQVTQATGVSALRDAPRSGPFPRSICGKTYLPSGPQPRVEPVWSVGKLGPDAPSRPPIPPSHRATP